ncbi:MAG: DUF1080 domain-containing protein [Planctomycetes bacterium]|nr:DUF1080 domain-containing protein [Planctomycetota bacterium]
MPSSSLPRFSSSRIAIFCCLLSAAATQAPEERLFDGRSLTGWVGDPAVWSVRDGCIVGSSVGHPVAANTFLIWQGGELADFELSFRVRLDGDNNSGVQYRSKRLDPEGFRVHGYQCDVHGNPPYFGMLYDEGGRGIAAQNGQRVTIRANGTRQEGEALRAPAKVDVTQWHAMRIVARGRTVQHYVDGELAVEFTDESPGLRRQGIVALQVHSGAPMTAWFQELVLRRLPTEELAQIDPAVVNPPSAGPVPQWIWDRASGGADEVFFRKEFELPATGARGTLVFTCDNHCRVWVNGDRFGACDSWESPRASEVGKALRQGKNVIAIQGWNDGGPAALAARLDWSVGDQRGTVVTDRSWLCSDDDPDGWNKPEFAATRFAAAVEIVALGGGPWGQTVAADAFDQALLGDAPQKLMPAPELKLAPGYVGERVFKVGRQFGSWVSLCMDPKGRLYASDQGSGLYRITPARTPDEVTSIERVEVELGGAQGLCWHQGVLYAVTGSGKTGLFRLRDTDGDDRLDQVELLRALQGNGEHGPHAVEVAPDGKNLLVLCGNHVKLPEFARSRLPTNWGEDLLLPRYDDSGGHAVGIMAPGGFLCLVDPDGKEWELLTAGFRNAYDLAVTPDGDVLVYDADMEWDMGLPWYRPTRILHCVSGADFGWRHGSGKWPVDYPDSLPAVCDVGPGSPTGMAWWRGRVLAFDWTFGTVHEVRVEPHGASLRGSIREFASAQPLPLTDVVVDGNSVWVLTGGRGVPSTLYRITAKPTAESVMLSDQIPEPRRRRLALEAFHGHQDAQAVAAAWPALGDRDPFLRHAARIAVEWQPVAEWRERALAQPVGEPWAALTAWLALARQGVAADLEPLLAAVGKLDLRGLDALQQVAYCRVLALANVRLGPVAAATKAAWAARLLPMFPTGRERPDQELCALLCAFGSPGVVEAAMPLLATVRVPAAPPWSEITTRNAGYGGVIAKMLADMPPGPQLVHVNALRTVAHGWTLDQRLTFFRFLQAARKKRGGASYGGYLERMWKDAMATCTPAEKAAIGKEVGEALQAPPAYVATPPKGPGRDWQLDEAAGLAARGLQGRSFASGRNLFFATSCAACHRFAGEGGSVGPDLTSLGNKFGARDVLEAILEPGKVISDQYGGSVLTRTDGSTLFGRISRATVDGVDGYTVVTATAAAEVVRVPVKDVVSVEPSKLSPMPADLVDRLAPDELLDLVAFLLSRGDEHAPMFRE